MRPFYAWCARFGFRYGVQCVRRTLGSTSYKNYEVSGRFIQLLELPVFHTQFDKYQAPCSVCHTVCAASWTHVIFRFFWKTSVSNWVLSKCAYFHNIVNAPIFMMTKNYLDFWGGLATRFPAGWRKLFYTGAVQKLSDSVWLRLYFCNRCGVFFM